MTHIDSFTDPHATDGARYGVRVAFIDEDEFRLVAFTHDVRRAVAADVAPGVEHAFPVIVFKVEGR